MEEIEKLWDETRRINSENTEAYPFRELKIEDVLKITMYDKETGKEFMDFPITMVTENLNERTSPCAFCPNNPSNGGSGICNCILGQPQIT